MERIAVTASFRRAYENPPERVICRRTASACILSSDHPPDHFLVCAAAVAASRVKRVVDIAVAGVSLLILAPLMAGIATAIYVESPGPILFRQARHGLNGEVFKILKFRTMYRWSEFDQSVPQARRNDRRVTHMGRYLRRLSLDELPQLVNVLRGEMSIVGPRPHAVPHNEMYARAIEGYSLRHLVKPGITGLAQVNGYRGETETARKMIDRLRLDLLYVQNWSPELDLKITLRTLMCIWREPSAY